MSKSATYGRPFEDLSGKTFGIWEVIAFDHMKQYGADGTHGISHYQCKCKKCGRIFIKSRPNLTQSKCKQHFGECTAED